MEIHYRRWYDPAITTLRTFQGAQMVKQINPSGSITISEEIEYQGKLYFVTYFNPYGTELWVSDGTEGTQQ